MKYKTTPIETLLGGWVIRGLLQEKKNWNENFNHIVVKSFVPTRNLERNNFVANYSKRNILSIGNMMFGMNVGSSLFWVNYIVHNWGNSYKLDQIIILILFYTIYVWSLGCLLKPTKTNMYSINYVKFKLNF